MSTGTGGLSPDDTALLLRLGAIAAEIDPVPDLVLEAGRAAFLVRRLDAELAELVADSATDRAGVRGGDDRLLSFEAGEVSLELQVSARAGVLHVLGQVVGVPVDGAVLLLETADGQQQVPLDPTGTFRADLPPGRFRLHLTAPGRAPVTTAWVT